MAMGKKAFIAIFAISIILVLLLGGLQAIEVTKANFIPSVRIEVRSPVNGGTYESVPLLDVVVHFSYWWNRTNWITYSVDDSANITLTGISDLSDSGYEWFNGKAVLPQLSEGEHYITVCAWVEVENGSVWADNSWSSSKIIFHINRQEKSGSTPVVEILSPENTTYIGTEVSLKVAVNTSASWIGYSLDNQANVTLADNSSFLVGVEILLTGLAYGSHNVVTCTNDSVGNMGKSDTVFFTIDTQPSSSPTVSPSDSPTQQPTMVPTETPIVPPPGPALPSPYLIQFIIFTVLIAAVVVGVGAIIYFKKTK